MSFLSSLLRRICAMLACAGALACPSLAQEPAAPPAQDPTTPVGIPAGPNPDDIVGRLAFSDTALDSVLQTLETLTGRIVIRPQALPAPQLTLNARQPLTRAEAILAIESLLSINGIGVVPFGEKFIKIVPIASIRTEAPELVVGTLRDQPPSGKVVSKLFRLQYLDSASFQQQVAPFLSGFGTIVPFQNSNAVIVTDTVANLQRLEYVVNEVDKRVNIETKFYQIRYATASELADQIRSMIESARGGQNGQGGGQQRIVLAGAQAPQPQPGAAPAGAPGSGAVPMGVAFSANTSITADDRTNQLIIIADPANLAFFDDLIDKLDVPADPPTAIEVIPMRYADAAELAGLLSQFISGQSQTASDRSDAGVSRERGGPFPNLYQPDQPREPRAPAAVETAVQAALAAEATQFSELMTIIADERSNAIIVSGTNGDLGLIRRVIEDLDVILAQVRLEVVIAEVTLNKAYARGIDAFSEVVYTEAGEERSKVAGAYGPISFDVSGVFTEGGFSDLTIAAVINAGRTNSDINLLSIPNIVTTHNKEASILVGQARPIVTSTQQSLTGVGGSYSTIQFQDIALELKVKPTIGPNDVVQLEIDQKVDSVLNEVLINEELQPIIGRRQATSYISVESGKLIVLGGLQSNEVRTNVNRMFILGDIPLLGELFTRRTKSTDKTELLLFIKPTVIRNTEQADADAREQIRELHPSEENAEEINKIGGERFEFESEEGNEDQGR
ncbi:MAG: type II secretion system secretin GspD [Opitutaceae bacterium]